MDLAGVAHELYGLPPAEFVAARTARAQQASGVDKALAAEIRGLTKPSVAAFVVNQLVRAQADDVDELIALGAALRQAQGGLDGTELRRLDRQRRQLTKAMAAQGRAIAVERGQSVSAAAAVQVDETLHAAMADPEAAEAVRSGRLSRALSATGFGRVDVTDAVAAPAAMASVTSLTERRSAAVRAETERRLIAARAELGAAERAADVAAREARVAEKELHQAREQRSELKAEVGRLRDLLAAAEQEYAAAKTEVKAARRRSAEADAAETAAEREIGEARQAVQALTGEDPS